MKITMFQLNIHHIKGESGWEIRAHDPMSFPMILALYHQDHSPIYPHQKSPDSPIYPPKLPIFLQESHIIPAGPRHANDGHHGQPSVGQLLRWWLSGYHLMDFTKTGGKVDGYWISMNTWKMWSGCWCNCTILKVCQWEGWHPIYEMNNIKCLKPPTSDIEESD